MADRIDIPIEDYIEIRRSTDVQAALKELGDTIGAKAEAIAGKGYYDVVPSLGRTRARVYVRAEGAAIPIEAQRSPLLQIVGNDDTYSAD